MQRVPWWPSVSIQTFHCHGPGSTPAWGADIQPRSVAKTKICKWPLSAQKLVTQNVNSQGDDTTSPSEWLKLKRLVIPSVGEDINNWNSHKPIGRDCKMVQALWKIVPLFLIKLKFFPKSYLSPRCMPKRKKNTCLHKDLCTDINTGFVCNRQSLEHPRCPSLGEWIEKWRYIHIVEMLFSC